MLFGQEHVDRYVATDGEEGHDWRRTMTAVWPDYDEYQKKTEREIPVVVLERRSD